jgi:hypothetical protein
MSSDAPIDIPSLPSRRDLLKAGGAALATGGVPGTGGVAQAAAGVRKRAASVDPMSDVEPFYGEHQGGIVTRTQAHTYLAAFDLTTTSRDKIWTHRTRTAIRSFPITRMCASQTACRTTVPRFCAVRTRTTTARISTSNAGRRGVRKSSMTRASFILRTRATHVPASSLSTISS